MADLVGQQFGNYRLLKSLGSGTFAEVYLGKHIYLETQAAIKVTLGKLSPQKEQKFRDEARNIAKLVHPHIVRFLEYGIAQNGMPYIVMDYAPQGTLQNRHSHGSILSLTTILLYVKQIAAALQSVHDQKLVHRDIKPENLLVDKNGNILVSDFGIAVDAHRTGSLDTADKFGTIYYMAPEHIRGKPRPASDQYSLAILVYEWLCGKFPFDGDSEIEIALQHVSTPPPPFKKALNIPSQVEQVVMKALAKDPHDRFESVQKFAEALEQAYQEHLHPRVVTKQVNPLQPSIVSIPQPTPVKIQAPLNRQKQASVEVSHPSTASQLLQKFKSLTTAQKVWWIIGIAFALDVVIGIPATIVLTNPERPIQIFCSDLNQGDYQGAYNEFYTNLQGRISEASFAQSMLTLHPSSCTYSYHSQDDNHGATMTICYPGTCGDAYVSVTRGVLSIYKIDYFSCNFCPNLNLTLLDRTSPYPIPYKRLSFP